MARKFRRPLSASVVKTLKAKAKKSKLFTFNYKNNYKSLW